MIEGLGYIGLEVGDLEKSLAFYCHGLRFDLDARERGDPPRAVLQAGSLRVVLSERAVGRGPRSTGIQLTVAVSGVDAYHDALVARGMVPSRPIDCDGVRAFSLRDPDGYRWTFQQSLT